MSQMIMTGKDGEPFADPDKPRRRRRQRFGPDWWAKIEPVILNQLQQHIDDGGTSLERVREWLHRVAGIRITHQQTRHVFATLGFPVRLRMVRTVDDDGDCIVDAEWFVYQNALRSPVVRRDRRVRVARVMATDASSVERAVGDDQ